MHLINDENGNPIPHVAGASCAEMEHCENGEHCGEHSHCRAAEGRGCPGHGRELTAQEQISSLLDYMAKNHQAHGAQLDQAAKRLLELGRTEASSWVTKAADELNKETLYLSLALSLVKAEK